MKIAVIQASCSQCGAAFVCGAKQIDEPCWCSLLPHVAIDEQMAGCLCPDCLRAKIDHSAAVKSSPDTSAE